MAKAEKLLEEMRRTRSGWKQSDFFPVLEYYGFEFVRHANHGAFYVHPGLAKHPDLNVRMKLARFSVPKGNALKAWVADEVITRIDFILSQTQT